MRALADIWPRHQQTSRPPRTAFVLSGGAAMGALQVGMLRALIERRILPDLIVGCSVGAINGVVLAGGPSLATVGRMQDLWMDLIDRELVPTGLLPSPVHLVRRGESISSNEGLRQLIGEVLPAATFEQLEVEFACVATNIDDAVEHWFTDGDLASAVLASASIPAVFPAVEIDGVRYLDGAIVDDVPIQRAVDAGATRIFVLQVGGVDRPRPDLRRPIDVALLAYWIARRHRLLDDLARVPEDVEVILLPHGDPPPVRYNDLSSSAHLMDVAYRASADHLDARIDGRIPPVFGPVQRPSLAAATPAVEPGGIDADAQQETAHRLFASARSVIRFGDDAAPPSAPDDTAVDPDDGDSGSPGSAVGPEDAALPDAGEPDEAGLQEVTRRLVERAESIGPAMRALIDRVLERGNSLRPEGAESGQPDHGAEGSTEPDVPITVPDGTHDTAGRSSTGGSSGDEVAADQAVGDQSAEK